jgi:type I restriction enzyme S subunit
LTRITRLKYVCRAQAGGTPRVEEPRNWDSQGIPWVTIADMTRNREVQTTDRRISTMGLHSKNLRVGEPGTVLFAMYASVGEVATLATSAAWNQAILGLTPRAGLADSRFIRYWLIHLAPRLRGMARSNTQDNLNAEQVGNLPFPRIPTDEQRTIADFLDRETARVDTLIARKSVLLKTLGSRRRALTDKLLSGAKAERVRIRHVIRSITSGPRGWSEFFADEGRIFLRITNVSSESIELVLDDVVRVNPPQGPEVTRTLARTGDVVVSITADIGSVGVVPSDIPASHISQHLALLRTNHELVDPYWLGLSLFGSDAQSQLDSARYGGTKTQLSLDDVRDIRIPLPRMDEQRRLLSTWCQHEAALIKTVTLLERQIALLRERRQALITAAVTGRLGITKAA